MHQKYKDKQGETNQMQLSDYIQPDGMYQDPNGVCWENPVDFVQGYLLGFCCCGNPENNLLFVRKVLRHIHNQHERHEKETFDYQEWVKEGAEIASDQIMYFAYYVFEKEELTKHGTAVPGWLSDKGKELLAILESKELCKFLE